MPRQLVGNLKEKGWLLLDIPIFSSAVGTAHISVFHDTKPHPLIVDVLLLEN